MQESETKELSTARQIFANSWRVYLPRIYVDDMELERYRGSVSTGNEQMDAFSNSRPRIVDASIAHMAEIYQQGVKPTWQVARIQTPEVYKILVNHINAGLLHYRNGYMSTADAEELLRDLQVLDEFAGWVYKCARKYMSPDDEILKGSLSERARERFTPMSRVLSPVAPLQPAPELPDEHTSLTDEIVERTYTTSRDREGRGWIG